MKEKLISEILKFGRQIPESDLQKYDVESLRIMLELRKNTGG